MRKRTIQFTNSFIWLGLFLVGCGNSDVPSSDKEITSEERAYWFDGKAELTSYELKQARYGELRSGKAVMVFVTEDFSTRDFVKVSEPNEHSVAVMKLNFTKKFTTGIYPYSIMTSSFIPFQNPERSLKVACSIQEWCGQVYMEMIRRKKLEINVNSYFEGETVKNLKLALNLLEDDIYSLIRLAPNTLPTGNQKVIPAFTYIRLMHCELKAYECDLSLIKEKDSSTYSLYYPELNRRLSIVFESEFPYRILSWKEKYPDGFGENKVEIESSGRMIKSIQLDYWKKNGTIDDHYREELGLE